MSEIKLLSPPYQWKRFGGEWMLCTLTGGSKVVLTTMTANEEACCPFLAVRDERGVLVELTPEHPVAEFIERACNSHDDLLAACKAEEVAYQHFIDCEDCDQYSGEPCEAWEQLHVEATRLRRAAIAKAEGR